MRAAITEWEFTLNCLSGEFRADARRMLRRGYDIHLDNVSDGARRLMIRLPAGLPCDRPTFDAFCIKDFMLWHADKKGKGGILEIKPEPDAGGYLDNLYDVNELLPEIAPVREQLIGGDLRPLYIAWLAGASDDPSLEPPVPAGLGQRTTALETMAYFFAISEALLDAAAERSPPLPATHAGGAIQAWIAEQPADELRELVRRFLEEDAAVTRAATRAHIRDRAGVATWPMADPARTGAQLYELQGVLVKQERLRDKQSREAARRHRLADMAADPQPVIAQIEKMLKVRSEKNCRQAIEQLEELCEALGPERGPATVRAVAEKLRREYPRLYRLIAALWKEDLPD
jgi:hypothetical protein